MTEESTTSDLVERVRRQFEAGNRRDIDAVMSTFAVDAVEQLSPCATNDLEVSCGAARLYFSLPRVALPMQSSSPTALSLIRGP